MSQEEKETEMEEINNVLNPDDFEEENDSNSKSTNSDDNEVVDKEKDDSQPADDGQKQVKTDDKKKQEEKNKYFAEQRRKREAEEREAREKKIREEAETKGKLSVLKTNTFTGEKINDTEDLKQYELMRQIAEENPTFTEEDVLKAFPKRLAEESRKAQASMNADLKLRQENKEKLDNEAKELYKNHPEALKMGDEISKEVSKLKVEKGGRWTLQECYEEVMRNKKPSDEEEAKKREKEEMEKKSKKMTSTPSANGKFSTPKNISEMSDEEFKEFYKSKYQK